MKESREEREKNVKFALAISSLGGKEPSEEGMKLIQDYIEGRSTIEENIEKLKALYTPKEV